MMLISLGLQLVHSTRIVWSRPLVTAVVMRGLVGPVVALVVGRLIGMSGLGPRAWCWRSRCRPQ